MSRFERPPPAPGLPSAVVRAPRRTRETAGPSPVDEVTTRPRAGVICNPRSHLNRRAEIAGAVPAENAILAAPRTHGELAATLSEFAARGIDLLVKVINIDNILFGSEMVGAVRGIDPETGHYFDDTKRYVDALPITPEQRHAIFEGNARRVFPRLDAKLKEQGK